MSANVITNQNQVMLDDISDPLAVQWSEKHSAIVQEKKFRMPNDDDQFLGEGGVYEYDDHMDAMERRQKEFTRAPIVKCFIVSSANRTAYSEAHWIMQFNFSAVDKARALKKLTDAGYKV